MQMKLRKGKLKLYNIKSRPDGRNDLCPLCSKKLNYTVMGEVCGNKKCHYVDGICWLNRTEYRKYKNKVENKDKNS